MSWGFPNNKTKESEQEEFTRINVRFITLDGLSREEVLSATNAVVPNILERRLYLSGKAKSGTSLEDNIQKFISSWNSARSRKYQYSTKDEGTNTYIYMEIEE